MNEAYLREKQHDIKAYLQVNFETIFEGQLNKSLRTTNGLRRVRSFNEQSYHTMEFFSECDATKMALYFKALQDHGLWPLTTAIRSRTVKEMAVVLDTCPFPKAKVELSTCESCNLDVGAAVKASMLRTLSAFGGLCLDCVKYGRPQESGRECRITHTGYLDIPTDK